MPRIVETLAGLWPGRAKPSAAVSSADETKASAAGPLIVLETLGRPVWTPRDYEAFAREGFMQNAIVYRAVRMISEAAASVPLLLYEGDTEIDQHPLLDLLARPSFDHTSADFLESWYGYLLVSGNGYVEAVAVDGKLRELYALRPDRMKVVPGGEGWPEAYEYTCAGRTVRFDEEPVEGVRPILHVRLFHPANDHYGMSPVEAAAQAIDIHNTAGRWNKALLDNSARPSGALVYGGADGRMTPEQFERLKAELEEGFQGPRRAGRPLLLEGGLDWKPLGLSPKDMDFIAARNGAAREIALAFGVPPMLLGIPGDNTYSNYQEAQRAFWRSTVLPLVVRTAKALSSWLAPAWDSGNGRPGAYLLHGESRLELRPDLDQIEALTSEREALWARIEKVSFLTLNEKRQAVGYAPLKDVEPPVPTTEIDLPAVTGKYNPNQPRAPRGVSEGGQWVGDGGGGQQLAQARSSRARRPSSARQDTQLRITGDAARRMREQVRQLDPSWHPRQSVTAGTVEGAIRQVEAELEEAQARWTELTRDAVPNTNPLWGVNRLRKELSDQGYRYKEPTDAPGYFFENDSGAQVRVMVRPSKRFRTDPQQKHEFEHYYRYRKSVNDPWGEPIPIPDKPKAGE